MIGYDINTRNTLLKYIFYRNITLRVNSSAYYAKGGHSAGLRGPACTRHNDHLLDAHRDRMYNLSDV